MNESLTKAAQMLTSFGGNGMEDIGVSAFFFLMAIALLCSLFISTLYLFFYRDRATGSQIHRAFPLLGISVTGIFICIQFSLPLSLGLLGALSIVRFRTPIKEPEEVGFIMLLIAVSIACATFNLLFVGIILTLAVVALFIQKYGSRFLKDPAGDGMLLVTLSEADYKTKENKLMDLLSTTLRRGRLESITQNGGNSILSYSFLRLNKDRLKDLQAGLRELLGNANFNIYFNRTASL